jgi:hypothetical protein
MVWTPFQEAELPSGEYGKTIQESPGFIGTFINNLYQVQMREYESPFGKMLWLAIISRDRTARHDWRHFQRIKNELCGPEREALEIYPAESRLVDTNNQFHLFVMPEGEILPLGYCERDVGVKQREGSLHKQRPFENPPPDLDARDRTRIETTVYGKEP